MSWTTPSKTILMEMIQVSTICDYKETGPRTIFAHCSNKPKPNAHKCYLREPPIILSESAMFLDIGTSVTSATLTGFTEMLVKNSNVWISSSKSPKTMWLYVQLRPLLCWPIPPIVQTALKKPLISTLRLVFVLIVLKIKLTLSKEDNVCGPMEQIKPMVQMEPMEQLFLDLVLALLVKHTLMWQMLVAAQLPNHSTMVKAVFPVTFLISGTKALWFVKAAPLVPSTMLAPNNAKDAQKPPHSLSVWDANPATQPPTTNKI